MRASKIAFEKNYSDDSGVQFGVCYDDTKTEPIRIEAVDEVCFPLSELQWLIDSLIRIRDEIDGYSK